MKSLKFVLDGPLAVIYEEDLSRFEKSDISIDELIASYCNIPTLSDPQKWFEALAIFETVLKKHENMDKILKCFNWLFKSFDSNAGFDLNITDYDWFWNKIQAILDKVAVFSSEALVEKAMQYFSARRGYMDKEKTLFYLQQAVENGSDIATVLLGYYYYYGFLGITDKEKGLQMMESTVTTEGKRRCSTYKALIALFDNRVEEAEELLDMLEKEIANDSEAASDSVQRMIIEGKAFLYDMQNQPEEAYAYYQKALSLNPSGISMLRLGYLHYNQRLKNSDRQEGLYYMEKAFRFGRTDAVGGLFYCYFESEESWQNPEKAIYFLQKGYEYNDAFSTYQLAHIFLYNETYQDTAQGLSLLDDAVNMGFADAYISKAYILFVGELLEKDLSGCIRLLEEADRLGSANAAYRLGYLYESGEISPTNEPDYIKALSYFEKAAEMGDMYSCEYAGRYYLEGLGTEKNPEKATYYYEQGRLLGSPYCIVELALRYEESDPVKSFELLKESVQYNYAYGQYLLGRCYRYGLGTEEDPDKAVEYFRLATDQDNVRAMAELALCYELGEGVEPNGTRALELMKKASDAGYIFARYKLGCYYLYDLDGVAKDYAEAFKWFSLAAEDDYPYALLELGDFYLYDYETREEYEKAYTFYERAARLGLVNEGMGVCLEYGYGTEVNEAEAFKYYLKAAEDGYIRAMNYTALCYYYGTGVKENYPEAFRWFNDASYQGHIVATYYKGEMLLNGKGCTQNIDEGIRLLQEAAENDEPRAQYLLGNCYLTGKGVQENPDLAMEWFEMAADNGHEKALKITGRRRRR